MSLIIQDGAGTGNVARVDSENRLHTASVTTSEVSAANDDGNAYNINTGIITLTSANESAVLYLKNTDPEKRVHLSAIVAGLGPSTGGSGDVPRITVIRNPTLGTIIDDKTAVDMNSNRNFSSNNVMSADVYKGAEGKTLTDGTDHILIFQPANGRVFAPIGEVLNNQASIGVKIDPQPSNSSMICYVALILHLEDI